MERNPITPSGYEQLIADLQHCKQVERADALPD